MTECCICKEDIDTDTYVLPCCNQQIHKSCHELWIVPMCPYCRNENVYVPPASALQQRLKSFADQCWNQFEVEHFNTTFDQRGFTPHVWVKIVYFEGYLDSDTINNIKSYFNGYCHTNKKGWKTRPATLEELCEGTFHALMYGFGIFDEYDG